MHLGPEMMFSVVAVVEENPIVKLAVTTYSPGNRFVGISAIVTEISIQIAETVAEIEERKKEQHVTPVDQAHWLCWHNDRHGEKHTNKGCELDRAPVHIGISALG